MPERIVITYGSGGVIRDHHRKYPDYLTAGKTVEIRGPCYSACTLVTAYFGKDKLCVGKAHSSPFMLPARAKHIRACHTKPSGCTGSNRRIFAIGSTATAAGKTFRSTAFGRCTIATCGRWDIRGASHDRHLFDHARRRSGRRAAAAAGRGRRARRGAKRRSRRPTTARATRSAVAACAAISTARAIAAMWSRATFRRSGTPISICARTIRSARARRKLQGRHEGCGDRARGRPRHLPG